MSQGVCAGRTALSSRVRSAVAASCLPAVMAKAALGMVLIAGLMIAPSSAAENATVDSEIPGFDSSALRADDTADEAWPPHPVHPELPDPTATLGPAGGSWIGPQTRGLNYAAELRQWVSLPSFQMGAFLERSRPIADPTCTAHPIPGASSFQDWRAHLVFMDVEASAETPAQGRYGQTQPFTVNAVAFGSIPVQATVVLEQPRRADGVVNTALGRFWSGRWSRQCSSHSPFQTRPTDTGLDDIPGGGALSQFIVPPGDEPMVRAEVRLRVDALRIDGVELDLAGVCRSDFAEMTLSNDPYYTWDPDLSPEDHAQAIEGRPQQLTTPFYNPSYGGRLFGSIEVGPFSGCQTQAGDDLSPLLGATVSGPDNPVEVRAEGLSTQSAWPDFESCPFSWNCAEHWPSPEIPNDVPEASP